jgi:hypothetical protein
MGAHRDAARVALRRTTSQKRVVVSGEGSYLRLIDSCITQLKAQRSSRTCNESKEEEKRKKMGAHREAARVAFDQPSSDSLLLSSLELSDTTIYDLKYEPSSEQSHISARQLFLN